jgi:SAM-dependent MidA family methyltransferase
MRAESFEHLLEIGAGSGQLAVDLLLALDARGVNVTRYAILELSASLRERQQEKIKQALQEKPHLLAKVVWLDQLPSEWCGIILGNEVLDAMPVNLYARLQGHWHERGVGWDATLQRLMWQDKILHQPQAILESISGTHDYITETHTMAEGFINSLSKILQRGVILLIDYGFPAAEYYHPQRCQGTLMAHYRHQAYTDPFIHPADAAGLMLEGYTSQANFLMNAGLLDLLMTHDVNNPRHYLPTAKVAQQLLSEAEMGELFKVIAFSRHTSLPLCGFSRGDRSHTL